MSPLTIEITANRQIFDQRPKIHAHNLTSLERLEKCNIAPLDVEKAQVISHLASYEDYHRTLLFDRRAELTAALEEIDEECKVTEGKISKMKRVLHPLRGLPNEILYEIFSHVLRRKKLSRLSLERGAFESSFDASNPLWTLFWVCKRWRNLLLATPRMWSCVNIHLSSPLNTFQTANLINLFVSRSQNAALDVVIYDAQGVIDSSVSLLALFQQSNRWRSLTILTTKRAASVFQHFSSGFACLEMLSISINANHLFDDELEYFTHSEKPTFFGFMQAPKLRKVRIYSDLGSFGSSRIQIPWAQITDAAWIDKESVSREATTAILAGIKDLRHAEFNLGPVVENPVIPETSSIRSLKMIVQRGLPEMLAGLRLPGLTSLSICSSFTGEDIIREVYESRDTHYSVQLVALPQETGYNLKHLSIPLLCLPSDALVGFKSMLASTPHLSSLEISLLDSDTEDEEDECLSICTTVLHDVRMVPRLESLTIRGRLMRISTWVVMMIMKRRSGKPGVAKLDRVVFNGVDRFSIEDQVKVHFEQFLEDGMQGGLS